jgi:hypothetical protein
MAARLEKLSTPWPPILRDERYALPQDEAERFL